MTTQEAMELLRAQGYSVRAPGAARASTGRRAGKQHRDCISHHRLSGYSGPVCVVQGQDVADVIAFAADVLAIGAQAGDVLTTSRMAQYGRQAVAA